MEKKDIKTLEKYISDYYEKVTADNAQQYMENFDENWKQVVEYPDDDTPKRQSKYGLALVILTVIYQSIRRLGHDPTFQTVQQFCWV